MVTINQRMGVHVHHMIVYIIKDLVFFEGNTK
jgi:hypothetical protein